MSATATENPATHDYLVTGETLFVTGAVLAFVSDVALTFRSLVLPNWIGLTLGSAFIVGTLYLINWLYSGKKDARSPAAIWCGIQIVIALTGAFLLLNQECRWDYRFYKIGDVLPQALSVPSSLLGLFKAAAYGFFLYLITQRGPALFFLRHKGGETVEVPSPAPNVGPEEVAPTGVVLPLAAEQTDKADTLASTLQYAGFALMAAGFFQAIVGGQRLAHPGPTGHGWIALAEGLVLLAAGLLAMAPVAALRTVKERGPDTAFVADALDMLRNLFSKQIILTLVLIALSIGGLCLRLLKG